MSSDAERDQSAPGGVREGWFRTTHWSVVAAAGGADSGPALEALETLCRNYWYPLYVYARKLGQGAPDAEDMVQSFFLRCLERKYLAAADPERGRFRTFLLVAFKRFMANEWDRGRARKRGGGLAAVAWEGLSAEQRYALEPVDEASPEKAFDRSWALALLDRVLDRLKRERGGERAAVFEELKGLLTGGAGDVSYAEIGQRLGMSEGAVKVAVHRLRVRYRQLLEEEIAQTVTGPEAIPLERRHLLAALGEG